MHTCQTLLRHNRFRHEVSNNFLKGKPCCSSHHMKEYLYCDKITFYSIRLIDVVTRHRCWAVCWHTIMLINKILCHLERISKYFAVFNEFSILNGPNIVFPRIPVRTRRFGVHLFLNTTNRHFSYFISITKPHLLVNDDE